MGEQIESSWSKLLDKLAGWLESMMLHLPNLLIAIVVFMVAYWLAGYLRNLVDKFLRKSIKQPSVRNLVSNIAAVLVIILGMILALSVLNLNETLKSILAGAGVAGLAVGLALQGILSNTFSGVFIALRDEINVGDWIETNGFAGTVENVNLRNTKIKESDNNLVVLPNKMILEQPFKNFGLTQRIRSTISCGVGYESDLREVKEIAIAAIAEEFPPNEDENIEFYYTEFGGSSINFILRFWVDAQRQLTALQVKSEAIMIVKEAFDEHDINIPFPIRTLIHENVEEEDLA